MLLFITVFVNGWKTRQLFKLETLKNTFKKKYFNNDRQLCKNISKFRIAFKVVFLLKLRFKTYNFLKN